MVRLVDGNSKICELLERASPFLVTRPGGTENQVALYTKTQIEDYDPNDKYNIFQRAQITAGIVNLGSFAELESFSTGYLNALHSAALIGCWYPANTSRLKEYSMQLIDNISLQNSEISFTQLEELLPWKTWKERNPGTRMCYWPSLLAGLNVLVIHPFEESIKTSYDRRSTINCISDLLPSFNLLTLKPPFTAGVSKTQHLVAFQEELASLKDKVSDAMQYADIALVGAGGYGAIISAYITNTLGKSAIHLGGALQLLFGIYGNRWVNNTFYKDYFSGIIDDSWSRPLECDVPTTASTIEGGCYI